MNVRTICPVKGLKGEVTIPGDKSISHRSIMLGSIALGTTEITHFLEGADCLSTIDCFRRMGVEIERKPSCILVHGKGLRGLSAPASTLNVGNSGTTTRLISGILSGQNFATTLSGDASLNSRPMKRIMTPLNSMGAHITSLNRTGRIARYPLSVSGCIRTGKISRPFGRSLCGGSDFCHRASSFAQPYRTDVTGIRCMCCNRSSYRRNCNCSCRTL